MGVSSAAGIARRRERGAARKEREAAERAAFERRSAAAKKGWETRRAREALEAEEDIDEEVADWAEALGISYEDAEALADHIDLDDGAAMTRAELAEYLEELSEFFEVDISDLFDMWYGYAPGSRGK